VTVVILALLGVGALALVVVVVPGGGSAPTWQHPFSTSSVFNSPIRALPRLDSHSSQITALLADSDAAHVAIYGEFGVPVYRADSSTPRYKLEITNQPAWGINSLSRQRVPIPQHAVPAPGGDGKLVVVDEGDRKVFDLWQAREVDGRWRASWGGVYDLDGNGSSPNPLYVRQPRRPPRFASRATGSGISTLAGLVRLSDVRRGRIDHALVFATDLVCGPAQSGPFRFPATTTDGHVIGGPCIPEGTWVQLDPKIDVNAIKGASPIERMVARALQRYGAFCTDNGGARMAIPFERPAGGTSSTYAHAGLSHGSTLLSAIPWGSLRVLSAPSSE